MTIKTVSTTPYSDQKPGDAVDRGILGDDRIDRRARLLEGLLGLLNDKTGLRRQNGVAHQSRFRHRHDLAAGDELFETFRVARDGFWQILSDLSRNDGVTIFVSTHFMNEAELCDRISLMHAGKVLVSDEPRAIVEKRGAATLEEAFISYLEEAIGEQASPARAPQAQREEEEADGAAPPRAPSAHSAFNLRRMLAYTQREALELRRDPIRAMLAVLGSVILMFVIGYGINLDVENLSFAVLDRDDTTVSRDYTLQIAGGERKLQFFE